MALDVRPILAAGEEPLQAILEAAGRVPTGGILEITAPFEPEPLYGALSQRGFGHRTTMEEPDRWVVRFQQTAITPDSTVGEVFAAHEATSPVIAEHGFDLCCGGERSLEFVAAAHGIELESLLAELQAAAME